VKGHFYEFHEESFRSTDASIANTPADRVSDSGQKTGPFCLHQIPDSALRHTDTSHEAIQKQPKRYLEDDGKSVSSSLRDLSLQQRKITPSNKRAAAEPAQCQSSEEAGRPTKLRSPCIDEFSARGWASHLPRPVLYYDAARNQGPLGSQPHVSERPESEATKVWLSTPATQLGGGIAPRDRLPPAFQSSLPKNHIPLANPEMERFTSTSPPASPVFTSGDRESSMLLQPETRPITQEQLVNEVKGIYAGLVMVEKKCVEVWMLTSSILSTAN
jgi:hypothetical protein